MTQEGKELVIKDLCGRLPYGVIVQVNDGLKGIYDRRLVQVFCDRVSCSVNVYNPLSECICIDSVKPYLRPLSSMTEEEQKILEDFGATISPFLGQMHVPFDEIEFPFITMQKIISYLYSIHIDINGMIPKGLALEVTEDNNPYKD